MLYDLRKFFKKIIGNNERGQTLVEYGLILVLVAVVVIVMLTSLGQTANNTYSVINNALISAAS
jgi:Flp pilus assembly pilin Flp